MQLYSIRHGARSGIDTPEIVRIVRGLIEQGACPACGTSIRYPEGDLEVQIGGVPTDRWPDVLACGYPCLVVSSRFADAMTECGIRLTPGGKVSVTASSMPDALNTSQPDYIWIDGARCRGGVMDFTASGFVDVKFCPVCGVRKHDIVRTYARQHAQPPPGLVIHYDQASGLDLFTTDLSPAAFFCTSRLLDCARKHRLLNISFRPVEQGHAGEAIEI